LIKSRWALTILITVISTVIISWFYATFDRGIYDIRYHTPSAFIPQKADPATLRATESGPVIGFNGLEDTHIWLGIPYAKPPKGDMRWLAPRPSALWEETLEALHPESPCIQPWTRLSGVYGSEGIVVGDEDCLYLNIWAPRSAAVNSAQTEEQLPVMVWIHGGSNLVGSATHLSGHKLAGTQQVVFVSIGYRLGHLGNFSHRAFRNTGEIPLDASANFGLLDIITALSWVKKNIANFGGDNENITLFGESSGGRNIMAMIASPLAEGLFHKAIIQSGSMRTESIAQAENFSDDKIDGYFSSSNELIAQLFQDLLIASNRKEAKRDIQSIGDENLAGVLRKQDASQIVTADLRNQFVRAGIHQIPQLIRDGIVLPKKPIPSLLAFPTDYNNVPIILGANRDDAKSYMAFEKENVYWYANIFPRIRDNSKYSRRAMLRSLQTHALAVEKPAELFAKSRLDVDAPMNVFTYRFDWDELQSNSLWNLTELIGAGQGLEIEFVFGEFVSGLSIPNLYDPVTEDSRDTLSELMMNYWGNFAYSGSPNDGRTMDQPYWKAWSVKGNNTLLLDSEDGGGARMHERRLKIEDLTKHIQLFSKELDQHQRCKQYARAFLFSLQSSDFWDEEYYNRIPFQGCKIYKKQNFKLYF
tara:strand:- start:175 stop:2106 length:1932 start_codon:yes stop_codon:yes gene_type:complete